MENKNEERWLRLCSRIVVEGSFARTRIMHAWTFAGIVRAYMSEGRAYHNLLHIEQCFDEFEQVGFFLRDPDAVEFALWYHDMVYDTSAKDNEERSARLAVLQASDLGFNGSFTEKVSRLILATKHDVVPEDPDAKIMVDIDLSILACNSYLLRNCGVEKIFDRSRNICKMPARPRQKSSFGTQEYS